MRRVKMPAKWQPIRARFSVGLLLCAILLSAGCILVAPNRPGCTDRDALNYDSLADVDNGSCRFSRIGFYASANQYEYVPNPEANQLFIIPIDSIVVAVDGSRLGTLRKHHPYGPPGSCNAPGVLIYVFDSGEESDWVAVVLLENGKKLIRSGTIRPHSSHKCITVDVTIN